METSAILGIEFISLIKDKCEFNLGIIWQLGRFINPQSAALDPAAYHLGCWIHDRTIARVRLPAKFFSKPLVAEEAGTVLTK